MDIVLFFQSTTRKSWRLKLVGAYRFAREHDWFVQVVESGVKAGDVRRLLARWNPVGCLVDRALAKGAAPDRLFGDLPIVYLDQRETGRRRRHPCLVHDSAAEARLAGAELLRLDCASYAFLGTGHGYFWEREREKAFRALCKDAKKPFSVLDRRRLADGLAALPKPCGVLAANDLTAVELYPTAAALGLSIPNDVAVAGIDNDEMYAEALTPGLTSAEPDFEGAGYRLAQMLAEEIARRAGKPSRRSTTAPLETYGALRLVRRGSTRPLPGVPTRVVRALDFIRRNACRTGFTTDDVAKFMGGSRRLALQQFKSAVGHTILEEIHDHRLAEAQRLLADTDLSIEAVANRCGYATPAFLARLFKSRFGQTIRAWRHAATSRPRTFEC